MFGIFNLVGLLMIKLEIYFSIYSKLSKDKKEFLYNNIANKDNIENIEV